MTDYERMELRAMLELAAKAAGLEGARWVDEIGTVYIGNSTWWNPLTNDGDALRLAVALRLTIRLVGDDVFAHGGGASRCVSEELGSDCYAATRRAITRAAAEIGRAMK